MTRHRYREAAAAASCAALGFVSDGGLAALARHAAVPDLAGRAAGLHVEHGSPAGSVGIRDVAVAAPSPAPTAAPKAVTTVDAARPTHGLDPLATATGNQGPAVAFPPP